MAPTLPFQLMICTWIPHEVMQYSRCGSLGILLVGGLSFGSALLLLARRLLGLSQCRKWLSYQYLVKPRIVHAFHAENKFALIPYVSCSSETLCTTEASLLITHTEVSTIGRIQNQLVLY